MLRSNLASRPFYNDRGVRAGLAVLALIAMALTVFNAIEILRLESAGRDARQSIAQNALRATELRQKAQQIRQSINQTQLTMIQTAAREANVLIDRRAFSWTALLNQFQHTLPPDVRIAGVSPDLGEDGRMLVQISVLARRVDDLNDFIEALESTGHFTAVLARTNSVEEDGTWHSQIEGYYGVPAADAAPPSPGASGAQAVTPRPSSEAGTETPANSSAALTGAVR
jgi:Tfp pilus assembly protein PilN